MWNMSWYNQGRHMDVTIGNLLSAPAGAYPHQFTLLDQDVEEKERHGQPTSALGMSVPLLLLSAFMNVELIPIAEKLASRDF
jgi:hypothetical protein